MKLDQYIEQTLVDIAKGVAEARNRAAVSIAPGYVDGKNVAVVQMIKFEISVTVEKEGSSGISVLSFGDIKDKIDSTHINKLTFDVPIYFEGKIIK